MPHLERTLEWLRPMILGSNTWNYCIVWKLGDDPSRFIEWVDCCCNGNVNNKNGTKMIKLEDNLSYPLCRDGFCTHQVSTEACEVLASMPSSMSLYSGIHGEVVISNRPRWLNIAKKSDSGASNEHDSFQTQVLIPVFGGLVELFSAKHIPEDERMIEFVKAQSIAYSQVDTASTSSMSFDRRFMNLFLDKNTNDCQSSLKQLKSLPWQNLTQISSHHGSVDGSSNGSFPSSEHTSPDPTPCSVSQNIPLKLCSSNHKDQAVLTEKLDIKQKPEREHCKSKNLHTERRRRKKIQNGLFTLRSLVPNISKMNRAAILVDAIDYILELQDQIKGFEDELNDLPKEDHHMNKPQLRNPVSDKEFKVTQKSEVQVQVNGIGAGHFLVRIKCQQKPGVLTKMLEGLVSLGLHINDVKDTNVTTCNGTICTTLILQTNKKDIQVEDLKGALKRVAA